VTRLLVAAATARAASARIDHDENDSNDDRDEDADDEEPPGAAPAGSGLFFTESGHETTPSLPLLKAVFRYGRLHRQALDPNAGTLWL
jgi:hypothetical protein